MLSFKKSIHLAKMSHLGLKWHTAEHVSWWHFNEIRKTMTELTNGFTEATGQGQKEGVREVVLLCGCDLLSSRLVEEWQCPLSVRYFLLPFSSSKPPLPFTCL